MSGVSFLSDPVVTLRTIETEDLAFVQENLNRPAIRRSLDIRMPVNGHEQRTQFEESFSGSDVHLLVCVDGERAGYVNLTQLDYEDGSGRLGVWIAPSYQGNGYAKRAFGLVTDYAFDQLRLRRVEARCFATNDAMQSVLSSLGFECEGRRRDAHFNCGEYTDEMIYAVLDTDWDGYDTDG